MGAMRHAAPPANAANCLLSSSSQHVCGPCSPSTACAQADGVPGAEQGAAPAGLHVQRGHRAAVVGRDRRERERTGLRRAHDAHGVPLHRARGPLLRAQRHVARAVLGAGRARWARWCAARASPYAGRTHVSTSLGTYACLLPAQDLLPELTRLAGMRLHAGMQGGLPAAEKLHRQTCRPCR